MSELHLKERDTNLMVNHLGMLPSRFADIIPASDILPAQSPDLEQEIILRNRLNINYLH